MAFISASLALAGVIIALIVQKLVSDFRFRRRYRLPPSPPGWPILGNMLDIPWPAGMWGVKMAKKYGDMSVRS